jgi:hypothetical protein
VALDAVLGTGKKHNAISSSGLTFTTTSPAAAGSVIVLCAAGFGTAPTAAFTPATTGVTWTRVTGYPVTSGSIKIDAWVGVVAAGLSTGATVTVTPASGTWDMMAGAIAFSGRDTTTPVSASNTASGTGTGWNPGAISANAGDDVAAFAFEDGSATATSSPTSPAVEDFDFNDATQTEAMTGIHLLNVSGTVTPAGTWSTSVTSIRGGVALKAAAGGTTFTLTLSASAGSSASMTRQAGKVLKATSAPAAVLVRTVGKVVAASSAGSAVVVRAPQKVLAAVAGSTATVATIKAKVLTLSAVAGSAAVVSMVRARVLTLVASTAASVALGRAVSKTVLAVEVTSATVNAVPPTPPATSTGQLPTLGAG